jgi:hypothetical protein
VLELSLPPMAVPVALAEATVRGGLRVGLGKVSLAGIVTAESIALMKGVLQSSERQTPATRSGRTTAPNECRRAGIDLDCHSQFLRA